VDKGNSYEGSCMKILMVDKYYWVKGGVERYMFELKKVFESNGHEIIPFSMKNSQNEESPYSKYFVENIDFNIESRIKRIVHGFKITGRVLYSFHAKRRLQQLLEKTKPDIAHIHMIDHQISPSILSVLKKRRIPVLQTIHNYKFGCPNGQMYIDHKNEICERCIDGKYYHAVLQRCHKDSLAASLLVTVESYLHHLFRVYESIQRFHVPSRFIGGKLEKTGVPASKIYYHPLMIDLDEFRYNEGFSNTIVCYGRLSAQKGIITLLKAFQELSLDTVVLKIIGEGPDRPHLEDFVKQNHIRNVSFLGYKGGKELVDLLAQSMFVVVPSRGYENSPLTILEPFALGKPVIGARIGGIPELIQDGVNGYLFELGNHIELARKMDALIKAPDRVRVFGKRARAFALDKFEPKNHYRNMLALYQTLLNRERIV
jgi:glycosyltransferase involved in cell wall biosynthesis